MMYLKISLKQRASFHSVIQKELQKRSLRNQRYEPEPGRPVANLSRDSYDSGLNQLYGTGKRKTNMGNVSSS